MPFLSLIIQNLSVNLSFINFDILVYPNLLKLKSYLLTNISLINDILILLWLINRFLISWEYILIKTSFLSIDFFSFFFFIFFTFFTSIFSSSLILKLSILSYISHIDFKDIFVVLSPIQFIFLFFILISETKCL